MFIPTLILSSWFLIYCLQTFHTKLNFGTLSLIICSIFAAFFIITFLIQNTRIPTGSMEDTILVGDFIIINKFIYGSTSPRYIPFTQIPLPYFQLPALREPKHKDIVVFEYPGDRDDIKSEDLGVNSVKTCLGLPGDTV